MFIKHYEGEQSIFPRLARVLATVGENIKLARLRRRLLSRAAWSAKAFRTSGNFAFSLLLIEKGAPTVAIGSYLQVLFVLGLENDFLLLAKDDVLGRKIQDVGLVVKKRAPKEKKQ